MNRLSMIPGNGITILRHLNEVMALLQQISENEARRCAPVLKQCEAELLGISIDIASALCSPVSDWNFITEVLDLAGIKLPEDLERDIREADGPDDDSRP